MNMDKQEAERESERVNEQDRREYSTWAARPPIAAALNPSSGSGPEEMPGPLQQAAQAGAPEAVPTVERVPTEFTPDKLETIIDQYIDDYELRGDGGDYTPSQFEKFLIKDAIMGLLVDPEFDAALASHLKHADQAASAARIAELEKTVTKFGSALQRIAYALGLTAGSDVTEGCLTMIHALRTRAAKDET